MYARDTQFGYEIVISVIISAGGRFMWGGVDTFPQNCYNSNDAATRSAVVAPVPTGKGVMRMVTYEALFAFCLVIISIVALFKDNKK